MEAHRISPCSLGINNMLRCVTSAEFNRMPTIGNPSPLIIDIPYNPAGFEER